MGRQGRCSAGLELVAYPTRVGSKPARIAAFKADTPSKIDLPIAT